MNDIVMTQAEQMSLGPVATINLLALRHNLKLVRKYAPDSKIMAVVKADAYGHGLAEVIKAFHDIDALAVARISEGLALRKAGIKQPIIILEGFFTNDELHVAFNEDLQVVIHQPHQVDMLEQYSATDSKLKVWLKVDTGMHRLGVNLNDAPDCYERLIKLSCCKDNITLMTHFANADDVNHPGTAEQIKAFTEFASGLEGEKSLANSAGIIAWGKAHQDWVRPGIMLYGASPMLGKTAADHDLKPVMTLSSQLIAINQLKQGDCIGYGSSWCCPEDMPVGVVAIGYGDGYPRHAPSGTPIIVNGQRTQIVGRVSMDMVTVDLRSIEAKVNDRVILWGEGLPAEEVAEAAGTISYELFCGVTSRVKYRYVNEN